MKNRSVRLSCSGRGAGGVVADGQRERFPAVAQQALVDRPPPRTAGARTVQWPEQTAT